MLTYTPFCELHTFAYYTPLISTHLFKRIHTLMTYYAPFNPTHLLSRCTLRLLHTFHTYTPFEKNTLLLDANTGRNVRFACLQIYCKSCYKFQICNDLPHLHACKLLICTRGKLGGKCGNGREAVRRKSVANPLQNNYFATSLHACKFHANTKFASDLHIRKSVDYIKLANGL